MVRREAVAIDGYLIAIFALTGVAFALRAAIMRDSLMGDELFMFNIVHGRGLHGMLSLVRHTEKTPPLFFLLAWAAAKIGDPTLWIRVPSLLLGTAAVPLTYLLALRTVGRRAGVVAAGIVALDPYSIFYGTEARAYGTLMFFAALSTLCLLEALRTRRRGWWVAYGLAVLAVAYTHYMGLFVLAAQALWALWTHRDQLRSQLLVYAGVALAYLPWLPSYLVQKDVHSAATAGIRRALAPPSLHLFAQINVEALIGHPFVPPRELPGIPAVVLMIGVIVVAAAAALVRTARAGGRDVRLSSPVTLFALLALATPLAVGILSVLPGEMSFMISRNLIASLVPGALVIGWLVTSSGRPIMTVAMVAATAAVLFVGATEGLRASSRRTPYRLVAHFIDPRARPGDPVIQVFWLPTEGALAKVISVNFSHPHPVFDTAHQASAWALGRRGARVFFVLDLPGFWKAAKHLGAGTAPKGFQLVAEHRYVGITDALVGEYRFAP